MARKLAIFFWAGTLVFLALIFVIGLFVNGEQGAAAGWIPVVGVLLFGSCAVGSTIAWLFLAARNITRPPTSNPAVEDGRAKPRAGSWER